MRRTTRYILTAVLVLCGTAFLTSCGRGLTLSEEEARDLINEDLKLPQIEYSNDKVPHYLGTTEGEYIETLIREGYLNKERIKLEGLYRYIPTDKGDEDNILGVWLSEDGKIHNKWYSDVHRPFYFFSGPVARKVLKSIDERLIDKEKGIARVAYATGYEPYEPYYSRLCKATETCDFAGQKIDEIEQGTITFKHSANGWGILDE